MGSWWAGQPLQGQGQQVQLPPQHTPLEWPGLHLPVKGVRGMHACREREWLLGTVPKDQSLT